VRRRLYLLGAAAVLVTATTAAFIAARGVGGEPVADAPTGPTAGPYRGSEPPSGISLPRFALREVTSGRLVRTAELGGRVVLVTFLDTDCTEQCPIIAGAIGSALRRLGEDERARTTTLAISVNPAIDTRAKVERFLRRHRVLGELEYLSGPVAKVRPIWRAFQIVSAYETGDADTHSADVRVYDPQGMWVSTLHAGVDLTPANLARDITTALRART
jgi:protein SCO1